MVWCGVVWCGVMVRGKVGREPGIILHCSFVTLVLICDMIQRNLETGYYRTDEEFSNDVNLVWNNCYQYNGKEPGGMLLLSLFGCECYSRMSSRISC